MKFESNQINQLIAIAFLASVLMSSARADSWSSWAHVPANSAISPQLATDGTTMYYSTLLDGVYRGSFADRTFSLMPMTGFPLWDANTNTNGFALANLAVTPQGTVVVSGSQIAVSSNTITFNTQASSQNTLPVFYWWDETNQLWHAATITGKTYPYTGNVGNFSIAPDGSLWTCSGFASYAYRSTDGGHSYTAFDINARVPTNYFPIPFTSGLTTFGEIFSVCAGWNNEVVIGTETGGYLHTTNNGLTWRSLDPNYANTNSTNPLGRTGDARVAGLDHYGNFLCGNHLMTASPAQSNWSNIKLIGWRPKDGSVFDAANGFTNGLVPIIVRTPPSGVTFGFASQNYLLQGGIFRALDGKNWQQFNQGSGLDYPFAPGLTNVLAQGNGITTFSNLVFVASGPKISVFDSTPFSVVNRPPVALPQNMQVLLNTPANLTLSGFDADGDSLNFEIVTEPARGTLSGTPPDLTYTPNSGTSGPDTFSFTVDDGMLVSAPTAFNLAINSPTNTLSNIALTSPTNGSVFINLTNLTLTAAASDPDGIRSVNFYSGGNFLIQVTNPPYSITLSNITFGDYTFSVRAIDNLGARTWSAPVSISILPVSPQLTILSTDLDNVDVTWPLDLDGFYLESAPDMAGPWTLSPYPQLYFPHGQTATIPKADQQFFRLMRPR